MLQEQYKHTSRDRLHGTGFKDVAFQEYVILKILHETNYNSSTMHTSPSYATHMKDG